MNSFVAFSCLLVAVTASPQYYQRPAYTAYGAPASYAPYGAASPYATVVAPSPVPTAVLSPEFTALLKSFAKLGAPQLAKATDMLPLLMKGLPAAVANMDPAQKADIGKVNTIITEVCSSVLSKAQPTISSNYTPQDLKATCDYISKVANDITAGLDNPAIIQSYVDKLKIATDSLLAESTKIV